MAIRPRWGGTRYGVGASVGLVTVNRGATTAAGVLRTRPVTKPSGAAETGSRCSSPPMSIRCLPFDCTATSLDLDLPGRSCPDQ